MRCEVRQRAFDHFILLDPSRDPEYRGSTTDLMRMNQGAMATVQRRASNPIDDFSVIYSGAMIRF
jgi:hypothetical protein